jgi:hypothetical protein
MHNEHDADRGGVGPSVPPPGFDGPPQPQPASSPVGQSPSPSPSLSASGSPGNRSKLIAGAGSALVAVVAGLAFLLFGSGGAGVGSPIAQAATLSSSTPGFRMQMSLEMTSSALNGPISATGSGVVDLRDHATAMSMSMNLGAEPDLTQQLGGSTMRVDMILVGATAYVKLPSALMSQLQGGAGKWMQVNLAKLSGVPGLSSLENGPTTADPSQTLESLRSVSGSVLDLGQAQVDGFATTHYRAFLSASRLLGSLPASEQSLAKPALALLQQALPGGEFPEDVWIDAHHLVRRVQTTLDMDLGGQNIQETVTVDLSDYGPQVPPAAPPASKVLNLSSLAGLTG